MTISRRDLLKGAAAAMALPALPQLPVSNSQPRFFTPAEFAIVDEMSDMIVPTDERSGGARAAGVAAYIDAHLAESFEPEPPQRWRKGLAAVEVLSREMGGKGFMESTPEQRLAVLTRMAAASEPKTPAQQFFGEIKGATIHAYYTSKIGIHDDQRYKGNVLQTDEFAGFDPE